MKRLPKAIIVWLLGSQVKRLLRKKKFTVIGVAGSIGKTSTKFAITQLLSTGLRVQSQEGNYNDLVTVPLVLFGHQNPPNLLNPIAWLRIIMTNERMLRREYPYDVVVLELGTDGPGQIDQFKRYLHLDIAVITAIAPEHMEFFHTLESVAQEELRVIEMADKVVVNYDLTKPFTNDIPGLVKYGFGEADYRIAQKDFKGDHFNVTLQKHGNSLLTTTVTGYAENILYSVLAAVTCADLIGLDTSIIEKGVGAIKPAPGRMQPLRGINDSLLLDDSYNASPEAAKASLDALYNVEGVQKIALLGNMNELGSYSPEAHQEVGAYCDPAHLDLVVTIGPDANRYTAPAARQKGCKVEVFDSPYAAGKYIASQVKQRSVILVKGSQNGVFAEEALKYLLADTADRTKLVRQSTNWLRKKEEQFSDYEN